MTIAELSNRSEFFDQQMRDREEEFKRELQQAERQTHAHEFAIEEAREAEKRRQQQLIALFDKLMHAFGIWDVNELVNRFLTKEEKFDVQYKYLDALHGDAEQVQEKVKSINRHALELLSADPSDDDEVSPLPRCAINARCIDKCTMY